MILYWCITQLVSIKTQQTLNYILRKQDINFDKHNDIAPFALTNIYILRLIWTHPSKVMANFVKSLKICLV